MNLSVHHIGVASTSPDRTIDFYVRLLDGMAAPMVGHTVVSTGNIRIAIAPRRDDDPQRCAWGHHIAFRVPVEERHAVFSRLDELGIGHEDVGGRIYARDPDGLTLEFLFEP